MSQRDVQAVLVMIAIGVAVLVGLSIGDRLAPLFRNAPPKPIDIEQRWPA